MNDRIHRFRGSYRFLSNFYTSPFTFLGYSYLTVEHAYQEAKTLDDAWRERIRTAKTPGIAKRIGREALLRENWENIKVDVMKTLLREKFFQNPILAQRLVETGDAMLEEGNKWGDTYWGTVNGKGCNILGLLLIELRTELQRGIWKITMPDIASNHI